MTTLSGAHIGYAAMPEHFHPTEARFWLGLGSGEAIDEHVIGGHWPEAVEPLRRMWQAVEIIDLGVNRVYLHNLGGNQKEPIDGFACEVLPALTA